MNTQKRLADQLKGKDYSNPFSEIKNVSSTSTKTMRKEFVPTSFFWSLFNNQHEIVIGTRGSGKTMLFRMMSYSMLKHLDNNNAKRIVAEKRFFPLYVPMTYDFVQCITNTNLAATEQERWFKFGSNCLIVKSFIKELVSIIEDYETKDRLVLEYRLAAEIARMWNIGDRMRKTDLNEIKFVVENMFRQQNRYNPISDDIPPIFTNTICGVIEAVVDPVTEILALEETPNWIVCMDEAENLKEQHIALLSKRVRYDIYHVVIKMADLPFFHCMTNPNVDDDQAVIGHDFIKSVLRVDEKDFDILTDSLCNARLKKYYDNETDITLEKFLGVVGRRDDLFDYYKEEFGPNVKSEDVYREIKKQISKSRRETSEKPERTTNVNTQSIYKKLAPIFYVREMKKRNRGKHTSPWFAGAKMVKRISQGNPRLFLRIMGELFTVALENNLTPIVQSETIQKFASQYRAETESLEKWGDVIHGNLEQIGNSLYKNVHQSKELKECGLTFKLKEFNAETDTGWLTYAIAYSRLFIENLEEVDFLSPSTEFSLSNLYSVNYWLPMRKDRPITISLNDKGQTTSHSVHKDKEEQADGDQ